MHTIYVLFIHSIYVYTYIYIYIGVYTYIYTHTCSELVYQHTTVPDSEIRAAQVEWEVLPVLKMCWALGLSLALRVPKILESLQIRLCICTGLYCCKYLKHLKDLIHNFLALILIAPIQCLHFVVS